MQITEKEKEKLLKAADENDWYQVCDEIKSRRNGQYPSYLAREILQLFEEKFPKKLS